MKKLLVLLLAMLVACTMAFSLVGCGEHEHDPSAEWKSDATHHWHVCNGEECTDLLDKAEHVDENGDFKCDVCEYVVHTHDHATIKNSDDKHWKECSCGDKIEEANHADANNDGKCDTCDVPVAMVNGNLVTGGGFNGGSIVLPEELA